MLAVLLIYTRISVCSTTLNFFTDFCLSYTLFYELSFVVVHAISNITFILSLLIDSDFLSTPCPL